MFHKIHFLHLHPLVAFESVVFAGKRYHVLTVKANLASHLNEKPRTYLCALFEQWGNGSPNACTPWPTVVVPYQLVAQLSGTSSALRAVQLKQVVLCRNSGFSFVP